MRTPQTGQGPHPLALFSLKPLNAAAAAVLAHPDNAHLLSELPNGSTVLDIGFNLYSKYPGALATLGSGHADILVKGNDIAPIQCTFEVNWDTGVVMLRDNSIDKSTQTFGSDAIAFQDGRPRRIVMVNGINSRFTMGGTGHGSVQFELEWHGYAEETMAKIIARRGNGIRKPYSCPIQALRSRLHSCHPRGPNSTSQARTPEIRHMKIRKLGSGASAEVFKAVNVDTGDLIAVKQFKAQETTTENERWVRRQFMQREVETLQRLRHPHIIEYLGSQALNQDQVEIFMGLKQGSVIELLVASRADSFKVFTNLVPQILSALDHVACHGMVHRDVKPANILYAIAPNDRLIFYLADFGLANKIGLAKSATGTYTFMAPEMFTGDLQTGKVDVWALFVTLMWVLNVDGFRQCEHRMKSAKEAHEMVQRATTHRTLYNIREMAAPDPARRASAAQMLVKLYGGKGLSTPLHRVHSIRRRQERS